MLREGVDVCPTISCNMRGLQDTRYRGLSGVVYSVGTASTVRGREQFLEQVGVESCLER